MNDSIAPTEVATDLLSSGGDVVVFSRGIRNQGHSKYIAISKVVPRRFLFVRMYKLAEKDNAVLLLFVDPTLRGYDVDI